MLVYGVDTHSGQSRHVRDVNNGLACGCVCPACRSQLIAQQGFIRGWHFRHASDKECSGALESSLHLRAKEILEETSIIALPFISVFEQATLLYNGEIIESTHTVLAVFDQVIALDSIKLVECHLGNIRPDLIIYSDGSPILVEIAVTHFVDQEKLEKIQARNISCVEIDLSEFRNVELSDADFERILLSTATDKEWIHHKDEAPLQILKKRELASIYGGDIQYVNSAPDGKMFGHDYSQLVEQLSLA